MRGLPCLLAAAVLSGAASAATISDVSGTPDYSITSVDLFSQGTGGTNDPSGKSYAGVQVNVSYGADTLVPFSSQGGYALVASGGETFDITLQLTSFDDDPNNDWDQLYVTLNVLNDSSFDWSDFHVEFYDATFTNKLGLTLLQVGTGTTTYPYFSNVVFDQSSSYGQYGGAELHFWSETATQGPGESNQISFRWDWGNPLDTYDVGDTIGIRLIATVPEPGENVLLALGVGALGWLVARSKRSGSRLAR